MTRARAGAVVVLIGLLAMQLWSAAGGAADLMTAGWWWRAQTGTVALPPPPHVPAGGLAVGEGADGPTAMAALRFALEDDEIDPVLSLVVSEELAPPEIGLSACPAKAPWFGIQAGTWDERPQPDCDRGKVEGTRSENGASWTFPLSALHGDGLLDVVIVPAEGSSPFEISFDPPTAASLKTTPAPTAAGFETDSGSGDYGGFVLPPSGFDGGAYGGFDFAGPPEGAPTLDAPQAAESAPDPAASSRKDFVNVARPGRPVAVDENDPRLLALVILIAALAAAVSMGREPLPAPRLLGPMAHRRHIEAEDEEVRGLGRFRRPRTGTAPSLH